MRAARPYLDFIERIIECSRVFIRFGKILLVVALAAILGAHWALLQSVAWTAMLADNLRTYSVAESVTRTFDGKHPCPLCRAIAAAEKSEKKSGSALQTQKLEFPPTKENPVLIVPSSYHLLPQANTFADSLAQKPPTPPPRTFIA
jgi:hypothetical protein